MRPNTDLKTYVRGRLFGQWTRPVLVAGICLSADMLRIALLLPFAAASGPLSEAIGIAVSFILSLLSYLLAAGEAVYHLAFLRGEDPAIMIMFRIFREQPDRFLILGFFWFLPELLPNLTAFLPASLPVRIFLLAASKRKLRLIGLVLSFAGYYILGILSLGVGLIFVYPYFHLTLAAFHLDVMLKVSGKS